MSENGQVKTLVKIRKKDIKTLDDKNNEIKAKYIKSNKMRSLLYLDSIFIFRKLFLAAYTPLNVFGVMILRFSKLNGFSTSFGTND